ncbi:MAG TPA: hypothetical protein VM694_23340 [Polyangium sp.]|nr:hypothetical protein [Polyangium sp.]
MDNKDIGNTTSTRPPEFDRQERERSMQVVTAGSLVEALGGVAAVVLAVLGLAGIARQTMIAVAIIAIGAALLFAGGALASRYSQFASRVSGQRVDEVEFGGGVGVEFLTGAAGVVMGVLILLGIAPLTLSAVSVVAFGGGLHLSTGATSAVNQLGEAFPYDRRVRMAREAVQGAAGVQALVGIGAAILGILALLGIQPYTLLLVALLGLGGGVLISASAVSGRMLVGMRGFR